MGEVWVENDDILKREREEESEGERIGKISKTSYSWLEFELNRAAELWK